jgi:hypothetical protein
METERAPVALAAFLARASPAAIPACRSMTNGRPVKWREDTVRLHLRQIRSNAQWDE